MAASAPKIVSMEIPIDKIGEVIGPKGKVINTLQQETGADIAVDDDGMVGTVTIGAKDANAVAEAKRRISLILDPPTADVGEVYNGKVVNLTKFGAFVNVLPGRDGLLHISKLSPLAEGRRVGAVEDVLTLGQAIEVRVDDIDQQGKVSLSLASEPPGAAPSRDSVGLGVRVASAARTARAPTARARDRPERADRPDRSRRQDGPHEEPSSTNGGTSFASFEDAFEAELVADLGDLGPGAAAGGDGRPGGDRDRAAVSSAPAPALSAGGAVPPIRTETLPSGLRLVTESMAEVRSVAVGFWVGSGSRDEPAEIAGASHFLEHLLFKGTPTRSAAAIAEALDEVGGDCNAYTTKEYTAFYVRLLAEHLPLGLDILSEIMWDPALRAERPRGRADGDPRRDPHAPRRAGRPGRRAVLRCALPRPPARSRRARHGRERGRDHRDRRPSGSSNEHYRPENMVVSVAGDCGHDEVAQAIEERFGGRTGGAGTRAPGPRCDPVEPLVVLNRPTEQAHLTLGHPLRVALRRRPLGVLGPQPRARRRDVEPPVPEGPRAARARLLDRLGAARLPGRRVAVRVRRAPRPTTSTRCSASSADELELLGHRRGDRARARGRQGQPAGRGAARLRGLRRPHEPDRRRPAPARRGQDGRRDPGADRTGRPRRRPPGRRAAWSDEPRTLAVVGPFDPDAFDGAALGLAGHVA